MPGFMLIAGLVVPAAARADQVIYDDFLQSGWENWSWATIDLTNTNPVHNGAYSIRVTTAPWEAVYFHGAAFDPLNYSELSFWINAGSQPNRQLHLQAVFENASVGAGVDLPTLAADTWQQIVVPLSALVPSGQAQIEGFWLQDTSGSGQPAFYMDDIVLIAAPGPSSVFYSGVYDGHEYVSYQAANLSWGEAQARVAAMGPEWYLATSTSAGENAFIASLLYDPAHPSTWIYEAWLGGYQDPPDTVDPAANWFWGTGESFYDNPSFPPPWSPGEPNDWQGVQEAYLAMFWNGDWNDSPVSDFANVTGYVAERAIPAPPARFPAFTQTDTYSNIGWGVNTTRGWSFTVSSPMVVEELGFWDSGEDGLATAHDVGLWRSDGTLLTSVTVPAGTGATLEGTFRWVTTVGVELEPGSTYVVGAYWTQLDPDMALNLGENVVFDSRVSLVEGRGINTLGLAYPALSVAVELSANLKARPLVNVPSLGPLGVAALSSLLGLAGWRRLRIGNRS